jgi:hypothetical protein
MNILADKLLTYCDNLEHTIQLAKLPSKWHPLQRAFINGRIACLNEQITNIRTTIQNHLKSQITNMQKNIPQNQMTTDDDKTFISKIETIQGSKQHPCTICNNPNCTGLHVSGDNQ